MALMNGATFGINGDDRVEAAKRRPPDACPLLSEARIADRSSGVAELMPPAPS
jgi:hypothetical protein